MLHREIGAVHVNKTQELCLCFIKAKHWCIQQLADLNISVHVRIQLHIYILVCMGVRECMNE